MLRSKSENSWKNHQEVQSMNFSPECQTYINEHLYIHQDELLRSVGKLLPSGPSNIFWEKISNKIEIPSVHRDELKAKLYEIADSVFLKKNEPIFIVNIDDAFPAIETNLNDWGAFAHELDYVNTIFLSREGSKIIHWDFYKDLHATNLDSKSV